MSFLSSVSFVMVLVFISYVAAIVIPFVRRRPTPVGDPAEYDWHFLLPCRDEEAVIADTLERCRSNFGDAHVWLIDDASTDATAPIAEALAALDDRIHVVRRFLPNARTGKGDALNAGYREIDASIGPDAPRDRVIIGVLDGDGDLDPSALDYLASPEVFGTAKVGAAQVSVLMKNRADPDPRPGEGRFANAFGRWLLRMQDLEFRTTIAGMQLLRARTSSVSLGGNGQFTRLSVLDEIAEENEEPWHGALLEDYELGVHVMLAGYENRYVHDTFVAQEALPHPGRLLTQRTRWAQGNMQCIRYLLRIYRCPHLGNAAVVESCYYLILPYLQILGTLLYPVLAVAAINRAASIDGSLEAQLMLAPVLLVFGFAPFALWGPIYRRREAPEASRWHGVRWGVGYFFYVHYVYLAIWRAFLRVVIKRTDWAKTARNAEIRRGDLRTLEVS